MAKKRSSRRRSSKRRDPQASQPVAKQSASNEPVNLSDEYEYVITDLRRIGILAAVLVALLVGLSFIL